MSRKNIIRLAGPPLIFYLFSVAICFCVELRITWLTEKNFLRALDPVAALYSLDRQIHRLGIFYPERLNLALGLLCISLALWFWKPNWLTGLLLVIPFYLLSSYTGHFTPGWAAVR